ncbi:MAG: hypoxanthine phosphoribosyltransferase [Deltaproteobacteria bacterium]|nr:MAG: hypoxanthine phosphoribosyltransferase [Deltaproteobacteria bacterium]
MTDKFTEKFKPLFTREEVEDAVIRLAGEISRDFRGEEVLFVGVLKGSFIFLADLVRKVKDVSVEVDFVRVRSYGSSTSPETKPVITKDLEVNPAGKFVIIVEDIIDTGETLSYLIKHIRAMNPKDLRVCTLIDKRERRHSRVQVDYAGFTVEKGFVVGYGLDVGEKLRELEEIKVLPENNE